MKSVLIAIQPKWVKLIAEGKKTVEVRKTKPKIDVPFKCYIYMTKTKPYWYEFVGGGNMRAKNGMVIGSFVCDNIGTVGWVSNPQKLDWKDGYNEKTCLTNRETYEYTKGDIFYEWHITDLVIYDKPKELGEFWTIKCTNKKNGCADCEIKPNCIKHITKPFQSWGYVEELGV